MQYKKIPKITMIVTVHNSEKYLPYCLESVCNQTLNEIEILCIDGGSTDSSPKILKTYQEQDSRIRIINDANTSYGHKINIGIQGASGRYIGILETDDRMKSSKLEQLYNIAEKYNLDYVDSNYNTFFEIEDRIFYYEVKKYGFKDCYDSLLHSDSNIDTLKIGGTGAIWTGIYKKQFLLDNQILMFESPGAAFQDTSFRFLVCALANSCYHLSNRLHCYRTDNVDSSIKDSSKVYTIAKEYDYLKQQLENRNIHTKGIWEAYYQWKYEGYYWNTFRLSGDARNTFLEKYYQELTKDIHDGNIVKNTMTDTEYKNTFMLIEHPHKFMECIEQNAQDGNLSFHRISNLVKKIGQKKFVIFGCGIRGKQFFDLYQNYSEQILCLCDNNKSIQYTELNGYKILSVKDAVIEYPNAVFVICNSKNYDEMKKQLLCLGIYSGQIYSF